MLIILPHMKAYQVLEETRVGHQIRWTGVTDGCEQLGTEPRYSGRVANALNHGVISPALNLLVSFVLFCFFNFRLFTN